MTILKTHRVQKFRERLYQKKMPLLLKEGTQDLKPIKKSKINDQGNTIIATKEIINFFLNSVKSETFFDADQYFSNLYLLFKILTKDSDQYTFESDVQVSVEDINAATNKKAIDYLTTNLIISFFENAHLSDGSENDAFLEKNLKKVIAKTNEGRDYRTLVGNTLQTMVKTLQEDKPWRESLDDIQTASLVCRLVGAKLPQIDKAVLSKNVIQAREEIKKDLLVFDKILNTREQFIREEKNQKNYLAMMKKLDDSTIGVLKKINTFLGYAHTFIAAIGASTQGFLGLNDEQLKLCIARFFFNYQKPGPDGEKAGRPLVYSTTRYRMGILMDFPELIRFTLTFKQDKKFAECFTDLFELFFGEIIKQMARLSRTEHPDTHNLESCLGETVRLVDTFGLAKDQMKSEKRDIQKRYLSLIRLTHHEKLPAIISLKERVSRAIQDDTKELMADTRRVLIDNCYSNLAGLEIDGIVAEDLNKMVRKLIMGYAVFYQPQRFFFQKFFITYISDSDDGSLKESFSTIIRTKKVLAISILTFFADDKNVGNFLPKNKIESADKALQALYNKK